MEILSNLFGTMVLGGEMSIQLAAYPTLNSVFSLKQTERVLKQYKNEGKYGEEVFSPFDCIDIRATGGTTFGEEDYMHFLFDHYLTIQLRLCILPKS